MLVWDQNTITREDTNGSPPSAACHGMDRKGPHARLIDLDAAASSDAYCQDLQGRVAEHNVCITELSTHLQGQLVAVHPAKSG
ncbi:hypothetical protein SAMN05518801_1139 [Novosphingobium sp. CF614]|uniref:hypothetical protein n=1 Tax=Novosphingobium sp. CF614 TaxID=1884364 RepID=UPI0008EE4195|nr:hypothetical protein SAMN05518801_1139 [Novosphingobium sp. CF614]